MGMGKGRREYLIREHRVHGLLLQDLRAGPGVRAVVQQHRDDLAVLGRFRETACASGVERLLDLLLRIRVQRPAIQMSVRAQTQFPVRRTRVHVGEVLLHVLGGKHVDVLQAHGRENVLLKIVVQRQA